MKFLYSTVSANYLNFATIAKHFTALSGLWFYCTFLHERTDLNSVKKLSVNGRLIFQVWFSYAQSQERSRAEMAL